MDSSRFDELTKALATSTSRRKALQRIGGTLAGSLLAAWPFTQALAAGGGNSACAHFCAEVFGADTPAAKQCTSEAAHGGGLCYICGPAAPANHPPVCGQVCCPSGQVCNSGTCVTPQYQLLCLCTNDNSAIASSCGDYAYCQTLLSDSTICSDACAPFDFGRGQPLSSSCVAC